MKTIFEAHGSADSESGDGAPRSSVALSFVIPVFNGAENVASVVERIGALCFNLTHEIVLVDDGSTDRSREVCIELAKRYPDSVCVLELARNFGEHNAVVAGLHETRGRHVVVLDDDGQNPPEEALRMWAYARFNHLDAVYARYHRYHQSYFRKACSWFNDLTTTFLLGKPDNLYLSSFKVMSRFLVDEILRYDGPFPYIDALILRTTDSIGACDVEHRGRRSGQSGYTLARLASLWLNTTLGYSIVPIRLMMLFGVNLAAVGCVALGGVLLSALNATPLSVPALPCMLSALVLMSGVHLAALGLVGEYVCRLFMHQSGRAQFVVRDRIRAVVHRANVEVLPSRALYSGVANERE